MDEEKQVAEGLRHELDRFISMVGDQTGILSDRMEALEERIKERECVNREEEEKDQ